jgi:hypothetical protein
MTDIHQLVDVVFTKLSLIYGRDFLGRWEGIDISDVKGDWSHELSGYEGNPAAIKYALQNLPNKAPTVLEFRAICQRAPETEIAGYLDAPKANPEVVRRALEAARAALTKAAK